MLHRAMEAVRGWIKLFFGQRWVRFGIVGAVSTAVYAALGLAFAWWNWPVLIGNALAYILSFVVSYLGQKNWTFTSSLPHSQLLPKFAALQGAGLLLNTAIIALLMHLGVPYMFAMPVAIVLVPVFVYVVSKLWIFRNPSVTARAIGATPAPTVPASATDTPRADEPLTNNAAAPVPAPPVPAQAGPSPKPEP